MDGNVTAWCRIRWALLAAGLAFASSAVFAQPTEIITVEATRSIATPLPSSVATIKEVSLTGWVRINGLDLTTSAGVSELEQRIDHAARELCKEVDDKYPLIKDGDCVADAVQRAMLQARRLVDAKRAAASRDVREIQPRN